MSEQAALVECSRVRRCWPLSVVLVLLTACMVVGCEDGDGGTGPEPPASARRYEMLAAGYYHTCGLTSLGTAFCWGGNDFGTLGDGTLVRRTEPTPVAGGHRFTTLDAGAGHNCALKEDGSAWCWGHNDEGQLGDGTFTGATQPVEVSANIPFVTISAGHAHSCAVDEQGGAWCWGDDTRGQLGDGPQTVGKSAVPVRVDYGAAFASVSAGYYQTCGITVAGEALCWGANDSGQLGAGVDGDVDVPVAVAGGHSFSALAPGDRFVCAIESGQTWCWGANRAGELGTTGGNAAEPVRADEAPSATRLTASMGTSTIAGAQPFACGLGGNGGATCWGGAVPPLREDGAESLDPRIRFRSITAGAQHICGLAQSGYAYCGGANYAGQLGDGTVMARNALVAVH